MSDDVKAIDLDAVRQRRETAQRWYGESPARLNLYGRSSDDVPVLLAEVERLAAERDEARQALLDLDEVDRSAARAEGYALAVARIKQMATRGGPLFTPFQMAALLEEWPD
jgi:hypothetical protein